MYWGEVLIVIPAGTAIPADLSHWVSNRGQKESLHDTPPPGVTA